jgi:hypothetical protein
MIESDNSIPGDNSIGSAFSIPCEEEERMVCFFDGIQGGFKIMVWGKLDYGMIDMMVGYIQRERGYPLSGPKMGYQGGPGGHCCFCHQCGRSFGAGGSGGAIG